MPGTCEILECLIDGVAVETATKVFLVELAPSRCVNFDCFFLAECVDWTLSQFFQSHNLAGGTNGGVRAGNSRNAFWTNQSLKWTGASWPSALKTIQLSLIYLAHRNGCLGTSCQCNPQKRLLWQLRSLLFMLPLLSF